MVAKQRGRRDANASRSTLLAMLVCLASALTLSCAAGQPVAAQQVDARKLKDQPWLKPPEQLTQADAEIVLSDSPWAVRAAHTVGGRPGSSNDCNPEEIGAGKTCYADRGHEGREIFLTAVWQSAETACRASRILVESKEPQALEFMQYRQVHASNELKFLHAMLGIPGVMTNLSPVAPPPEPGDLGCPSRAQSHRIWLRAGGRHWIVDAQKSIRVSTLVREFPDDWRGGPDTGELLRRSFLQVGKAKLNPIAVRLLGPGELLLDFPAFTADGKPSIPSTATTVQLFTFAGKKKVKLKFDLRKMVTAKGRDL